MIEGDITVKDRGWLGWLRGLGGLLRRRGRRASELVQARLDEEGRKQGQKNLRGLSEEQKTLQIALGNAPNDGVVDGVADDIERSLQG